MGESFAWRQHKAPRRAHPYDSKLDCLMRLAMGAWGYGIFEDDVALDVRGDFEEAVNGGASIEEASAVILGEYAEELEDVDDGPVVYLALAALQVERGRVQDPIRREALRVIDEGTNLPRWEDAGEEALTARKRVLDDLRTALAR